MAEQRPTGETLRTIELDWIQAMSRMINALFSRSPRSAYEILNIRLNGIGSGQSTRRRRCR
jgi:hypothetical protein